MTGVYSRDGHDVLTGVVARVGALALRAVGLAKGRRDGAEPSCPCPHAPQEGVFSTSERWQMRIGWFLYGAPDSALDCGCSWRPGHGITVGAACRWHDWWTDDAEEEETYWNSFAPQRRASQKVGT